MEGPKSTQVLAASIELERLTPCTEVTAPRPKYDLQELRDQSPEARSRRAKSDYAMQNAGLLETLKERWTKLLEPKEDDVIYDCSPGQVLKWCDSGNGLLAAIEKAYSRHLHLHLRPDDVWLTICQGVSRHLQHGENAEKYRSVFVDHEGQEEITVFVDQFLIPGKTKC